MFTVLSNYSSCCVISVATTSVATSVISVATNMYNVSFRRYVSECQGFLLDEEFRRERDQCEEVLDQKIPGRF